MLSLTGAAASAAGSLHGCRSRCGFALDCSTTDDGLEKLFVFIVEIVDISLPPGQVRMLHEISWQCFNVSNNSRDSYVWYLNLAKTPYRFSDVHDKFTVIGCDALVYR